MVKLLVRLLLLIVIVVVGFVVYVAVAGAQVTVASQGCGTLTPPVSLPVAWQATSTGGIVKVPPMTVNVVTEPQNGQETIVATGPLGIKQAFQIASNVSLIRFDSVTLFRRSPLLRNSPTLDLSNARQHQLLLVCH